MFSLDLDEFLQHWRIFKSNQGEEGDTGAQDIQSFSQSFSNIFIHSPILSFIKSFIHLFIH